MKSKINIFRPWRPVTAFVLCMAGLLILMISQSGYAAKMSSGSCAPDCFVYLPVIQSAPPSRGIYGRVTTEISGPIANVPLDLRFYNGSAWSTLASTNTDGDGMYSFTDMPGLQAGQRYYVRYLNTTNEAYLYTWRTLPITTYSAGQEVAGGDFDITNIALQSPASNQQVSLPATFHWSLRNGVTAESYEFNLFDYDDSDPYFFTDPALGYVSQYTLNSLPPGFQLNTWYTWDMWVYGPNGNETGDWGISYWSYWVAFNGTNFQDSSAREPIKTADLMSYLAENGAVSADLDLGK